MKKLLIANRGEIAVRITRTAAEMGLRTVAVFAEDDAASMHTRVADVAVPLTGSGPAAYLDGAQIIAVALAHACDAVHPGYGFLSENAAFARQCGLAGITFVGPDPDALELFGDKTLALALAQRQSVPTIAGTRGATTLQEAHAFMAALGPGGAVMLKALAGGGGRGMRPVMDAADLAPAFERCQSEACNAFGNGDLYVEQLLRNTRHVEVQILGDGSGAVVHLWDRECSVQRQRQKLIEIAPATHLRQELRTHLFAAALRLGRAARYRGLATVEFLVQDDGECFAFIEANPRLQVEHTVTEAVTGLDLVRLQLQIAAGASLADLELTQDRVPAPRGQAIQVRVNLETMGSDGLVRPTGGVLGSYQPPSGPGIRLDGFAYPGYRTSTRYDSLLAKLIVHAGDLPSATAKAVRALAEFDISGAGTNIALLSAILKDPAFVSGAMHTQYVEEHIGTLALASAAERPRLPCTATATVQPSPAQPGWTPLLAPMQGSVISLMVQTGSAVHAGQTLLVIEAMKMEHVISAKVSGYVRDIDVAVGDTVYEAHVLLTIEEAPVAGEVQAQTGETDPDAIRPDLAAVLERHRLTGDAARPEAVARRRKSGQRTVRENIDDLLDPGSFVEYGALTVAARRQRNSVEELISQTPADGIVMGLGRVNGSHFADDGARVAVMGYDYTVLAGTQGVHNHRKMDRMIELARRLRLPTLVFCEGGGGRPGDTEGGEVVRGFEFWGRLSGVAPLVGITSGRCYAGNASVLGCCDVIIATQDANIGMGGPALIEGGGLGVFRPEEIGPVSVQQANGVIDLVVANEAEAVARAKQYLSYFQGALPHWTCADQRKLRCAIPENRLRFYDIHALIRTLADDNSVLELRGGFGRNMVTALIRVEGRPMGLIANNPKFLGGAIDSDAADKAARFLQICQAFDLPVLSLVDAPGMMVGPEVEKTALVRHCSRLFIIGANLSVPLLSVVLRKSYGLGALAMIGGSYHASLFTVAWPTAEFGAMGLEGSVKLGFRNELAAIADPEERKGKYQELVASAYEAGKALSRATTFNIDDAIDPSDTRRWILGGLRSLPPKAEKGERKRKWIDAW